ncbi:MAG: glycine/D-amino acid oxidase-like deaminating enzyme [Arenicella sp.]|jgi:glycine/D-amino acid oxidase-like deaminating enzyme
MSVVAPFSAPLKTHYDVVIVGGAKIGSSVAWFLSNNADFDGSILVVEKDPTYAFASTSHTNSCMRQQFSTEINIRVSQFAAEFVNNFQDYFLNDPRVPTINLQSFGYMTLADNAASANALRRAQALQASCGAGTKTMTPEEIKRDYPFYFLDDIVAANHNLINEGYYDGNTVFDWWKRSAREKGAEYIANQVVAMTKNADGSNVVNVSLASGEQIGCAKVVNASGPSAAVTSRMAGIDIPVEPRKRYSYIFAAEQPLDRDLPLTIDPSGVHVRSEGQYYLAGCPPDHDPAVGVDDFIEDHSLWQDKVWPAVAKRIPQFEAVKLINSWVGHYAFNTLDQNAILGAHDQVENFIFVNGFSGHGFQQAPAMGRGVAELITYGEYRTLDLTPFGYQRVADHKPFTEHAVI